MLTQKDYVLIAEQINRRYKISKRKYHGGELGSVLFELGQVVDSLCDGFKQDNLRFDERIFKKACFTP